MGSCSTDKKDGEVAAAKLIVYAGEDEEYFTFTSKEAWLALNDWMDYRRSSGELITDNSWVMRDLWDTRVAQGRGLVTKPKKLASSHPLTLTHTFTSSKIVGPDRFRFINYYWTTPTTQRAIDVGTSSLSANNNPNPPVAAQGPNVKQEVDTDEGQKMY